MNYYFSLILAIGITSFNSSQVNLSLESRTAQTHNKSQLVTQVTTTNIAIASTKQVQSDSSKSQVESAPDNFNQNLLLAAMIITSVFTTILLLLLFKKVEINLNEEPEEKKDQEENTQDENTILQQPKPSQNGSISNNDPSSEQSELQEDTVIVPLQNNSSSSDYQSQLQDTVIVPPYVNSGKLDVVPELIRELQNSDRKIRPQTIGKLSQSGDSRAMIPLVELMIEADTQERGLILEAMQEITSSILKPMNQALILSLRDENSQVKQTAIRDLTRMYEVMSHVTERLSHNINGSEKKLPETAQWALKQLKQMPETPTWQLTNLINN